MGQPLPKPGAVVAASAGELPLAFARLHLACSARDHIEFGLRTRAAEADVRFAMQCAGFTDVEMGRPVARLGRRIRARRVFTLPDFIRPELRLLICGLNPSIYSAETGIPFGRPGNRFWPAARRAGLLDKERDPFSAVTRGIGFTDLVKRATRRSAELSRSDFELGFERLELSLSRYRPRRLCLVGLQGWRRAIDSAARAGPVAGGLKGRPTYLMPSTSGRNAHADLVALTRHLRRAADI